MLNYNAFILSYQFIFFHIFSYYDYKKKKSKAFRILISFFLQNNEEKVLMEGLKSLSVLSFCFFKVKLLLQGRRKKEWI